MTTWDKATVERVLSAPVELTQLVSDRPVEHPVVHACMLRDIQRARFARRRGERICTIGRLRNASTTGHAAVTCTACVARLEAEQARQMSQRPG